MKNIHLIVASSPWTQDGLRYRRHRLAEYLRAQDATKEVIWLCPSADDAAEDFTTLENGIKQWRIGDLSPHKIFRFARFVDYFYREKVERFLDQLHHMNGRFFLWYTFPGFPLLADLFPWEKIIYDCSDLWGAPISGRLSILTQMRRAVIGRAETRIIRGADQIYCTSEYLHRHVAGKLPSRDGARITTLENGVEYDWFNRSPRWIKPVLPEGFRGKVIGYLGGIKPKLDFQLVRAAALKQPDWLFLFIGPDNTEGHADFQRLLELENVLWTGPVAPEEVPDYMRLVDLGMMPYKASPYNAAVFPLKLFEFLAAGKPAVGVCLPSTRGYDEKGVYTCLESDDPDGFLQSCRQLLENSDAQDLIARRKAAARRKDWPRIFDQMTHFLNETPRAGLAEISR